MSSLLREALTPEPTPAPTQPPAMEVVSYTVQDEPAPVSAKPLAVILLGDPKVVANEVTSDWANMFYNDLYCTLEDGGYRVEFDYGRPRTYPNRSAKIWVAHDAGILRMRHADPSTRRVYLETQAAHEQFESEALRKNSESYYLLSERDKQQLKEVAPPVEM